MKNEPAFPSSFQELDAQGNPIMAMQVFTGITMRQYYKAAAMKPVMDSLEDVTIEYCAKVVGVDVKQYKPEIHWPKCVAIEAGKIADAMLAEDAAHATGGPDAAA